MLEKLRQRIAPLFEEEEEQGQYSSVKFGRLFLWIMAAGIIGGLSPFIWPTNHGLLLSYSSATLFIILTAKPLLKWILKSDF